MQNNIKEITGKINLVVASEKLNEYIRILKLAKRPTRDDFFKISKIAGAAMALIGLIGFTIYLFMTVLPKGF